MRVPAATYSPTRALRLATMLDRRPHRGIGKCELGRKQGRFGGIDPRLCHRLIGIDDHELLVLVGEVGRRLIDRRMGLHPGRRKNSGLRATR
jgi:hypothetical protein